MPQTFLAHKKKTGLALAIGALSMMGTSMAHSATDFDVDVNAFYRVSAYGVQNKNIDDTQGNVSNTDTGISHVLRVGLNLKDKETGIALYSSAELAGDRWQGIRRDFGTHVALSYATVSSAIVRLDHASLSLPIAEHVKLNIGRHATSYNNCFLVCEGRRGRLSSLYP